MLTLEQLEQLVAVADYGTLSAAAEALHISQPTLTRSMQKLETEFAVPLFIRSKNKLTFHENGVLATEQARRILNKIQDMLQVVRANHTLAIGSCAPMPLLDVMRLATQCYPDLNITIEMKSNSVLLQGLQNYLYQLIVLPYSVGEPGLESLPCGKEQIFFALPPNHPLAGCTGLHWQDMDGTTMLLYNDIGFWYDITLAHMPHSHFLMQNELSSLAELMEASVIPAFVSDRFIAQSGAPAGRHIVPLLEEDAHAAYYAVYRTEQRQRLQPLLQAITVSL